MFKIEKTFSYPRLGSAAFTLILVVFLALLNPLGALGAGANSSGVKEDPDFPGHVLGSFGHRVKLASNLEYQGRPHPCAGRELVYHTHVDAAYATSDRGRMRVLVVDGTRLADPKDICVRLAPDANNNGLEVSRFIVPNRELSFLGAPGTILWNAPVRNYDNWRPVWAGFGAFDSHHELKVPTDFTKNEVLMTLDQVKGPGVVEVFNYSSSGLQRSFSSRDPLFRTKNILVGSHSHMDWTFSQPGIYELGWKASGSKIDGTVMNSELSWVTWLVGSDQQVGLPPGTTTGLNQITKTTEDQRREAGLDPVSLPEGEGEVGAGSGEQTGSSAPKISDSDLTENFDNTYFDTDDTPTLAPAGPLTLLPRTNEKAELDNKTSAIKSTFSIKSDDGSFVQLPPASGYQYALAVPDSQLKCVDPTKVTGAIASSSNGWVYELPASSVEGLAQLALSTDGVDPKVLAQAKIDLSFDGVEGPPGYAFSVGNEHGIINPAPSEQISGQEGCEARLLDMDQTMCKATIVPGVNQPLSLYFSKPGFYTFSLQITVRPREDLLASGGGNPAITRQVSFPLGAVVGNQAINRVLKQKYPDTPLLGENQVTSLCRGGQLLDPSLPSDPGPTKPVVPNDPVVPSDPGSQSGPGSLPVLSLADARADISKTWPTLSPVPATIIANGHMDMAVYYLQSGQPVAALHDEQDPAAAKWRPTGSFAFPVPDSTFMPAPASLSALGLSGGVWALPAVQDFTLPWLGFNTQYLDAAFSPGPVTVALSAFSGPGRMISGHDDSRGIEVKLDSHDKSHASYVYANAEHDHQAFFFSAPGLYTADFTFSWDQRGAKRAQASLRVAFLVGDASISEAKKLVAAAGSQAQLLKGPGEADANVLPTPSPLPSVKPVPLPSVLPPKVANPALGVATPLNLLFPGAATPTSTPTLPLAAPKALAPAVGGLQAPAPTVLSPAVSNTPGLGTNIGEVSAPAFPVVSSPAVGSTFDNGVSSAFDASAASPTASPVAAIPPVQPLSSEATPLPASALSQGSEAARLDEARAAGQFSGMLFTLGGLGMLGGAGALIIILRRPSI